MMQYQIKVQGLYLCTKLRCMYKVCDSEWNGLEKGGKQRTD
jgi:hypothetical protein